MNEKNIPDFHVKSEALKKERKEFFQPLIKNLKEKGYTLEAVGKNAHPDNWGREIYGKNSPFERLERIMLSTLADSDFFRVRVIFDNDQQVHEMRGVAYTSGKFDRKDRIEIAKNGSGRELNGLDFFIPQKDILGDDPDYETAQARIVGMVMGIHSLYK